MVESVSSSSTVQLPTVAIKNPCTDAFVDVFVNNPAAFVAAIKTATTYGKNPGSDVGPLDPDRYGLSDSSWKEKGAKLSIHMEYCPMDAPIRRRFSLQSIAELKFTWVLDAGQSSGEEVKEILSFEDSRFWKQKKEGAPVVDKHVFVISRTEETKIQSGDSPPSVPAKNSFELKPGEIWSGTLLMDALFQAVCTEKDLSAFGPVVKGANYLRLCRVMPEFPERAEGDSSPAFVEFLKTVPEESSSPTTNGAQSNSESDSAPTSAQSTSASKK